MSTVPIMEGFKKERGKEREASGQRGRGESGREGERDERKARNNRSDVKRGKEMKKREK